MSRLVDRPVPVGAAATGEPLSLNGETVLILEAWRESGRWWLGEPERDFFRVQTRRGGLYEIARERGTGAWRLVRIFD